jgi:hypothetical protein
MTEKKVCQRPCQIQYVCITISKCGKQKAPILGSSVAERSAVNRLVVGSNPTRGVTKSLKMEYSIFRLLFFHNSGINTV